MRQQGLRQQVRDEAREETIERSANPDRMQRSGRGDGAVSVLPERPKVRTSEPPDSPRDPEDFAVPGGGDGDGQRRLAIGWKRAFGVVLLCFALWLILDAQTLMNNSEASVLGTRRNVAMDVLRPIAWVSRNTGLSHVLGAVDRVLGRGGSGAVAISSGPTYNPNKNQKQPPPPTTVVTTKTGKQITKPVLLSDGWAPFPPISAANPLRVLIVGDSVGTDLGQYALVDQLGSTHVVSATLDGQISTGLTRPDYFNWPAELKVDLAKYHPQLTIICIGANDAQGTYVDDKPVLYGTSAWQKMYQGRVSSFISEATSAGSRVLWVGMPPMASSQLNSQMENLNEIYAAEAGSHPGARFLSSFPVLGGPGYRYTAFNIVDGSSQNTRTDDGIHLQPAGAQLLGEAVIKDMDLVYRLNLTP
jgi:hypothetical protein